MLEPNLPFARPRSRQTQDTGPDVEPDLQIATSATGPSAPPAAATKLACRAKRDSAVSTLMRVPSIKRGLGGSDSSI